jgi:hypothetical protein
MAIFCTTCGKQIEDGSQSNKCVLHRAEFCSVCGTKLSAGAVSDICPKHDKPLAQYRSSDVYCTSCGAVGLPRGISGGELFFVLIVSIFTLFIPLMLYLFVRSGKRCRSCGKKTVIPVSSPVAHAALAR